MNSEQNKNAVRRVFQALNAHDLDGVLAGCADDCVFIGWAPESLDKTGYRAAMAALLTAFPNARFPIDELVAEGDSVVCRHRMEGTQSGAYMGIPATGRSVTVLAHATFQMEGGVARRLYLNADFLGLLATLGALPAMGQ